MLSSFRDSIVVSIIVAIVYIVLLLLMLLLLDTYLGYEDGRDCRIVNEILKDMHPLRLRRLTANKWPKISSYFI